MATIKASELGSTIKKKLEESSKQAYKQWADKGAEMLKDMINSALDAGKSPVEGEGSFKAYADSTKKTKRRKGQQTSPVNLSDTGKFRASLTIRAQAKSIAAWFNGSRNADILDYQADADKSRKALPRGDERFNKTIRQALKELFLSLYKVIK